jgi:integrase/recombinase XerD
MKKKKELHNIVGKIKQRIYAATNGIITFKEQKMGQARTLNDKELNLLLLYIKTRKFASRDRAMVLMTYWSGARIKEVALTKISDVLDADGTIKREIRLTAQQTKGKYARTIVLAEKLRSELKTYLLARFNTNNLIPITYTEQYNKPLFATQKREGFSPNTACYHLHTLYKAAGMSFASSHSGRRTFLTNLSAKSVPLKVLMELANHRQAQTTMRYISVTTDMKHAAVELI